MSVWSKAVTPGCAAFAISLFRRKACSCQSSDLNDRGIQRIHLKEDRWQPSSVGPNVRVLPVFAFSGASCFLPHSGAQRLQIYEPRYRTMYHDLLSGTLSMPSAAHVSEDVPYGAEDSHAHKRLAVESATGKRAVIAAWTDDPGESLASVGVVLVLQSWSQVSDDPPRFAAVHEARERARILRIMNPDDASNPNAYLIAEVEILEDAPGLSDHAAILEAWKGVWRSMAELVAVQKQLQEEPRLTEAVLSLGRSSKGVLSAKDLWRPLTLMHELQQRQAAATHRHYGELMAAASAAGRPLGDLQHAYKAELHRLQRLLIRCPALLQAESGVQLLTEAKDIIDSEVHRLQQQRPQQV